MNIRKPRSAVADAEDTTQLLATGLRAAELSAGQRDSLRERILLRARETAPEGTQTRRGHAQGWMQIAPHVQARLLNVDAESGVHISLLRMSAGGVVPEHRHSKDEEFIVLEGECHVGSHLLVAGDIHCAAAGSVHGPVTTRSSVLVYLRGEYPYPRATAS